MAEETIVSLSLLAEPWPVRHFASIDSTSLEAQRYVADCGTGPVWFRADEQTAGKGRTGRSWISEPGNLYATGLLPLTIIDRTVPILALTSGLAVHDTFRVLSSGAVIAGLKWPNDVRVQEAKISGMLLETGASPDGAQWVSFGIGLNLRHAPDLRDYKTTSLWKETGITLSASEALTVLDQCLRARLQQHMLAGTASIISDWMRYSDQIGKRCQTTFGTGHREGVCLGLDAAGQLLLRTDAGEILTVSAGDVNLVRDTSDASGN